MTEWLKWEDNTDDIDHSDDENDKDCDNEEGSHYDNDLCGAQDNDEDDDYDQVMIMMIIIMTNMMMTTMIVMIKISLMTKKLRFLSKTQISATPSSPMHLPTHLTSL